MRKKVVALILSAAALGPATAFADRTETYLSATSKIVSYEVVVNDDGTLSARACGQANAQSGGAPLANCTPLQAVPVGSALELQLKPPVTGQALTTWKNKNGL